MSQEKTSKLRFTNEEAVRLLAPIEYMCPTLFDYPADACYIGVPLI
jgi:hypothetical protein